MDDTILSELPMTVATGIAKNSSFIFLGNITGAILQFVLLILLARYLGPATFGVYRFALSFTAYFLIFSSLGFDVLIIREVARDYSQASNYLSNVLVMRFALFLALTFFIYVAIRILQYAPDLIVITFLVWVFVSLAAFADTLRFVFRAFEKMQYELITRVIERSALFVGVVIMLLLGYQLPVIAFVMVVIQAFSLLLTFGIVTRKLARFKLTFDPHFSKLLLKLALPLSVTAIIGTIYAQIDITLLYVFKGNLFVGWYSAPSALLTGAAIIPSSFIGAVFPLFSKYFVSSKDKFLALYRESIKLIIIFAVPFAVVTSLFAESIIATVYGGAYGPSVVVLQILVWATAILFLTAAFGFVLTSINKALVETKIILASTSVNILLDVLLIPRFGFVGVSVTNIVCQVFVLVISYAYLFQAGYTLQILKVSLRPLTGGFIMGLYIYFYKLANVYFVIGAVSACIVYVGSLYALNTFNDTEKNVIKSILRRMHYSDRARE